MTDTLTVLFICFIPVFFIMMLTPFVTRKTESFGVSIPYEVYLHQNVKLLRKKYVISIMILNVFTLISLFIIHKTNITEETLLNFYFPFILILYFLFCFLIYLYFHMLMKRLKAKEKWFEQRQQQIAIQSNYFNQKLTYSVKWYIIGFIITGITFLITMLYFDKIPEKIPTNYNFFGEVTKSIEKSPRSAFLMPIMQTYMLGLFLFIHVMIARSKQQISAVDPEKTMEQSVQFRRRWSLFTILTGILLTLFFSVMQITLIFDLPSSFIMISSLLMPLFIISYIITLAITTGQGGSRVKKLIQADGSIIDRDDDKHWKLGVFYLNKNDPAIFLEKRFGIGWTINFANPLAWLILVGITSLAILIPNILS